MLDPATGKMGLGSSERFELSAKIVREILNGKELSIVMDEMTGKKDVRSGAGAMGILTCGLLNRAEAYDSGIIFAFAPFITKALFQVRFLSILGVEKSRKFLRERNIFRIETAGKIFFSLFFFTLAL